MTDQSVETQIALLQADMAALTKAVAKQSSDIEGLVQAWKTANGVVSFMKWLASIAVAVSILIGAIKFKLFGAH
jgi:hypothetical protein